MSFESQLKSLITDAHSSLQNLESLLLRMHSWFETQDGAPAVHKEEFIALHTQIDAVRARVSASLEQMQTGFDQEQQRLSGLEDELRVGIERLKEHAVDHFIKEQYKECVELLDFISKIQPNDEHLERFLDLSRQKLLENENSGSETVAADSTPTIHPPPEDGGAQPSSVGEVSVQVATADAPAQPGIGTPGAAGRQTQTESVQSGDGRLGVSETLPTPSAVGPDGGPASLPDNLTFAPEAVLQNKSRSLTDLTLRNHFELEKDPWTIRERRPRRRKLVLVSGLLLGLAVALVFFSRSQRAVTGELEVHSEPTGANVFVDGRLLGQTQIHVRSLKPGKHDLRLEKQGYARHDQEFQVQESHPAIVRVRLEKMNKLDNDLIRLRERAQALFEAGELRNAEVTCDAILEKDGQDAFALRLKAHIQKSPQDRDTGAELAEPDQETTVKPPDQQMAAKPQAVSQAQLQKPSALTSQTRPPPALVQRPQTPSIREPSNEPTVAAQRTPPPREPANSAVAGSTTRPAQIAPEALRDVEARIQAKEFDQARALLGRLQNGFPGNRELETLSERLRSEETKQQALAVTWVQRAESALIAGQYVTPPNDNVLVYCNRALAEDPRNQRALSLKQDVVSRAVTQAKDWIQRGRFDAARVFFASLNYLALNDNQFPYPKAELKQELEKLEFRSFAVSHEHGLGRGCAGRLIMNAYVLSYVPSQDSGDGFTESLKSIIAGEEGEKLRVKFRDKTYRFHPNTGGSRTNRDAVRSMYVSLIRLMAD
jgi:hypothetical protein